MNARLQSLFGVAAPATTKTLLATAKSIASGDAVTVLRGVETELVRTVFETEALSDDVLRRIALLIA
jgi:hypothetical protein